jgi:hypothetical protein
MENRIFVIRWLEFFYTLPFWILAFPYVIFWTKIKMTKSYRKSRDVTELYAIKEVAISILIGFFQKRLLNASISTMAWIFLYQIFLK